ncbi:MAG: BTAD domain-containing putative transcriptional regulator [Gemmatimonadales bacterium]
MVLLKTLGGLSLDVEGAPATGAAQQRKPLALLALLAANRRGISRDKVIAYLWPESDTEHARNTLKQACHALRRDLHPDLFLGTIELRLNPNVITSDVGNLEDALDRGEPAQAIAAYAGPFLDGFYLASADDFERWVEETRAAIKKRVGEALDALATQAASSGNVQAAVQWWRRRAALDPLSARAATGLLRALIAAGDGTAALEFGRVHENLVRQELGTGPDATVADLLQRLRQEGRVRTAVVVGAVGVPVAASTGAASVRAPLKWGATHIGRRLALGGVALALGGLVVVTNDRTSATLDPELVAIAPFEVLDPRLELWRKGLMELVSRDLDGMGPLRTVSSSVVMRRWKGALADRASVVGLGRRTGAGVVLFGQVFGAGTDSVRLRAHVLDAGTGRTIFEIEASERADRMDRLADSVTLRAVRALLPAMAQMPASRVSVRAKSLPALKAFLQGERYFRQFWLDSAVASYAEAVALDSTFALALSRSVQARGWNLQPNAEPYMTKAALFNRGLGPRDSLMLAYYSQAPTLSDPAFYRLVGRQETTLIEMIKRYPEDPELWHEVGEVQFHLGFVWLDSTWNRARRSFDRAIARDSGYAIAYVHPVELALSDNDPAAALRYVRGFLDIPSVNPEGAGMHLLELLLDPDHARGHDLTAEIEKASLPVLRRIGLAIRSWPDSKETHIEVARRAVAAARASLGGAAVDWNNYDLRPYLSSLADGLIFRGHLREARRLVGNRVVTSQFMQLAQMGAIPPESVETALLRATHAPDEGYHGLFPWILEGPCYRTFDAALWWASQRDTVSLLRLARHEAAGARTLNTAAVSPYARPVPEFVHAALALARGDTATALRRFRPDSSCPGAQQPRSAQFRLLVATGRDAEAAWVWERTYEHPVPLMLERARVAERLGDRPTAIKYYRFVVEAWLHADPELQPFVIEARAALRQLEGKSRR